MSGLELVITVAILGMLFVLTLKGRDFVQTMRALMTSYQIQHMQNRVMSYQAQYSAYPGDDPAAPRRFGREGSIFARGGAIVSYAGDAKIDGKFFEVLSPNGEQYMAWRDLRYARVIDGDPAVSGASAMPENAFGGVFGFDEGNLGQVGGSLCATRVPGRAAASIDKRIDDGLPNKGKLLATSQYDPVSAFNHFETPDSQPYHVEKEYIICVSLLP